MGPAFDEAALAQLTDKIDKTLAGVGTDQHASPKRKRPNTTADDRDAKRRQKSLLGIEEGQQDRPSKDQSHNATKEVLLEEILALGGDEDDLELVANVDSDTEEGPGIKSASAPEKSLDKSFHDELAKFALSLGFQNITREDDLESVSSENPVDEEQDEEDDAEQTKQDDSQDQEQPLAIPATVKSESTTTTVQDALRRKQGKNKLVSSMPSLPQTWRYANLSRVSSPDLTGMPSTSRAYLPSHHLPTLDNILQRLPTSKLMRRLS